MQHTQEDTSDVVRAAHLDAEHSPWQWPHHMVVVPEHSKVLPRDIQMLLNLYMCISPVQCT